MEQFTLLGITHHSAPLERREQFCLSRRACRELLYRAVSHGIEDLVVISTCNRTELLSRTNKSEPLLELFLHHTGCSRSEYQTYGFCKKGEEAIRHLYRVAVGLEAQVLGDLQIINQVKQAYKDASDYGIVNGPTHRLMQSVFRVHKRTRSETGLASGAATIAFAAVRNVQNRLGQLQDKKILLIGAGEIGRTTCKNLVSHGARNVTLMNRNQGRAEELAERYAVTVADITELDTQLSNANVIIVATDASQPVITQKHLGQILRGHDHRPLIMDLSVPRNVDPSLHRLPQIELINLDMLREAADRNLQKRRENIPGVERIIEEELQSYCSWLNERQFVPVIRALKQKLESHRDNEIKRSNARLTGTSRAEAELAAHRLTQKILAQVIAYLKSNRAMADRAIREVASLFKLEEVEGVLSMDLSEEEEPIA